MKASRLWIVVLVVSLATACGKRTADDVAIDEQPTAFHVFPGEEIQAAIDRAAEDAEICTVIVHAGIYRPSEPRQALIWFNRRHDGLQVRAEGEAVLTAANPMIADRTSNSFPATVNHVVYFGDGISSATKFSGFTITGANGYVTTRLGPEIEADHTAPRLKKTAFFYTDGGGVKIFGRSYPTLENLEIRDNYSSPCGAGISIEHRGYSEQQVAIRNCVFRNNRVPLTGAALGLLDHEFGGAALVENCLFVNNLANCTLDDRSKQLGTWKPDSGHGAVTVFKFSTGRFRKCTFVANRNGVDDISSASTYEDCIFWDNNAAGGWPRSDHYEMDVASAGGVRGCFIDASHLTIDPNENVLECPDPEFNEHYVPQNSAFEDVGYRPANAKRTTSSRPVVLADSLDDSQSLPITIIVRGQEFGWNIQYPGNDRQFDTKDDVTTRRHLRIPVGTVVRLEVRSDDYLYNFSLPQQSVKKIAIPGMTHRCSFVVDKPGIYPLVGDQFCGYTHPDLIGKLIVKEPEEFSQWLEKQDVR